MQKRARKAQQRRSEISCIYQFHSSSASADSTGFSEPSVRRERVEVVGDNVVPGRIGLLSDELFIQPSSSPSSSETVGVTVLKWGREDERAIMDIGRCFFG